MQYYKLFCIQGTELRPKWTIENGPHTLNENITSVSGPKKF